MTISYSGNFFKLLIRWKGGIWKAVWHELVAFLILFYSLNLVYRFALNEDQKTVFEKIVLTFDRYTGNIPITFLLGFYIAAVVKRWWAQFSLLSWPEDVLSYVNLIFPGGGAGPVATRRNIARWLNLTAALAWREISVKVRKRFPTIQHLVACGLMTETEFTLYNSVKCNAVKWFLPTQWIQRCAEKQLLEPDKETKISCAPAIAHFIRELNVFRASFRKLYCYDWVCIPLVYTQVAAIATYGFFVLCIIEPDPGRSLMIGRQSLNPDGKGLAGKDLPNHRIDLYFPFFTVLQFIFYIGWFKVGQYLMRPFEEDDDDIELNYLLDRNIWLSFATVDEVYFSYASAEVPDKFRHMAQPALPYTKVSATETQHPPKVHSIANLKTYEDQELVKDLKYKPSWRRKTQNIRLF